MAKAFIPVLPVFTSTDSSTQDWMADINKYILATSKVSPMKTADFTCDLLTYFYPANKAFGCVANLPQAKTCFSKPYAFWAAAGSGVTITPYAGDTVNGAATLVVAASSSKIIRSDGVSNWYVESAT